MPSQSNQANLESMLARVNRLLIVPNLPPETRSRMEIHKKTILKALLFRAAITADLEGSARLDTEDPTPRAEIK